MESLRAFLNGIRDGWEQFPELSSGLSFEDRELSELYDRGVNCGEALRVLACGGRERAL